MMSSAAAANTPAGPVLKDLYEVGEIPPEYHVPKNMYAWAIRKERHGRPATAMQVEVVPTWEIGEDEVLVLVMAAGRQLQRHLGLAGRADFAAGRTQAAL